MENSFTVAMIKSGAVARGHAVDILSRIADAGLIIAKMQQRQLCPTEVAAFYHEHQKAEYYPNLVDSVTSGPVICLLLYSADRGGNAVALWRGLMGRTTTPDTLRALYSGSVFNHKAPAADNAVHGSDSHKSALYERSLLFKDVACKIQPRLQEERYADSILANLKVEIVKDTDLSESDLAAVQETIDSFSLVQVNA